MGSSSSAWTSSINLETHSHSHTDKHSLRAQTLMMEHMSISTVRVVSIQTVQTFFIFCLLSTARGLELLVKVAVHMYIP